MASGCGRCTVRRDQGATVIQVATWIRAGGIARHGCGRSLWLQVRGATASWVLRYRFAGAAKSMGLGACDLSGKAGLTLARAAADAALVTLREGRDPAAAKQERRAAAAKVAEAKAATQRAKAPAVTFK